MADTTHATPGATDTEADATEGRVYNVAGGDWDAIVTEDNERGYNEQIVINMGPQHPSTHGVLRLILTLEGETVTDARASVGYLHTGIEKSMEFRTWTQGTTFITRADYLTPLFNEATFCLGVERLLGVEDRLPERAQIIRVLMLELNRIASHLGGIGPFGLELGATTIFLQGVRMRENVLDLFELITGLRMNHAFIRPGGVAQDLPAGGLEAIRDFLRKAPGWVHDLRALIDANPVFAARTKGIAYLSLEGCMALGVTGPILRATGLPWDLRKSQPYSGYEQSLRIIEQCVDRLAERASLPNDPYMIQDAKIGWPARLSLGPDGLGPSPEHIAHIMGQSMEALIHHFKLVTEGFRVPAGQAYVAIESPKGELGCHVVSDGGTRPYRAHLRDPSFHHMQAVSMMCEGGNLADVIPAIASIDPVIGGVDR
jgi:NADH-quinone oxidoreductase subunit D